jgi:hypothetical protein
MLTGILELDRMPLSNSRVLLISGDMDHLIDSAISDANGLFQFPLSDRKSPSRVVIMAKVKAPVVAISHRVVEVDEGDPGPQRLSIDTSGDQFHTLAGRIASNDLWPPYLLLHLDPVHLAGVPEPLEKFFDKVEPQVIESWFLRQRIDGDNFSIRVQSGSYRFDVHYFSKSQPPLASTQSQNFFMSKVSVEREADAQVFEIPFTSYLLNVERDLNLNVTIDRMKADPN